jgi:hypothetical protein
MAAGYKYDEYNRIYFYSSRCEPHCIEEVWRVDNRDQRELYKHREKDNNSEEAESSKKCQYV